MPIAGIELSIEDGLVIVRYRITALMEQVIKLALMPVAEDAMVIAGIGRSMGETMRLVKRDGKQIILYAGYEIVRDNNN